MVIVLIITILIYFPLINGITQLINGISRLIHGITRLINCWGGPLGAAAPPVRGGLGAPARPLPAVAPGSRPGPLAINGPRNGIH